MNTIKQGIIDDMNDALRNLFVTKIEIKETDSGYVLKPNKLHFGIKGCAFNKIGVMCSKDLAESFAKDDGPYKTELSLNFKSDTDSTGHCSLSNHTIIPVSETDVYSIPDSKVTAGSKVTDLLPADKLMFVFDVPSNLPVSNDGKLSAELRIRTKNNIGGYNWYYMHTNVVSYDMYAITIRRMFG